MSTPADGPDLNVGLVGFGFAGQTFHAPLIRATAGLRLAAVGSSNAAAVRDALGPDVAVVPAGDLPTAPGLDVVVVATPNETHCPLALAALRAGRHVVVDKPLALDAAEGEAVAATAKEAGKVASVFHNRRWDSDFLALREVLRSGRIGRAVELQSAFDRFRPTVRARWREGAGPGAGLWADLGPHLVDQAIVLFGVPTGITLDAALLRDGALSPDYFTATLRYAGGAAAAGGEGGAGGDAGEAEVGGLRVVLRASVLSAVPAPRFTLHGTKGSWTVGGVDAQEGALRAGATPDDVAADTWGADSRVASVTLADGTAGDTHAAVSEPLPNGAYPAYYAGLRDAVRGAGENPVPAEEALIVQRILDAGVVSNRERREVLLTATGGVKA